MTIKNEIYFSILAYKLDFITWNYFLKQKCYLKTLIQNIKGD